VGWYNLSDFTFQPPEMTTKAETLHPLFANVAEMTTAGSGVRSSGFWVGESAYATDVAGCTPETLVGYQADSATQACAPVDAPFTVRIDNTAQVAACGQPYECLGGAPPSTAYNPTNVSEKLTRLAEGQAIDLGVRFVTTLANQIWSSYPSFLPLLPDMSEAFTALIRYTKPRDASANIWVTQQDGSWRNVTDIDLGTGPDVWTATGLTATGAASWEWMQVYPAYLSYDKQTSTFLGRYCSTASDCAPNLGLTCQPDSHVCTAAPLTTSPPTCASAPDTAPGRTLKFFAAYPNSSYSPQCIEQCNLDTECGTGGKCLSGQCVQPAIKVRLSGAHMSESCSGIPSGTPLFKGANEQGSCSAVFKNNLPPKKGTVCPKEFEAVPQCRGALAWTTRKGVTGWFCRGGGEALYQCTPEDAPDLDAVAFVPGKPWCAPDGATSFVGVCK
jgi:hypothetical protein